MAITGSGSAPSERSSFSPLRASISALPRRVNHGGAAWLKRRGLELRQPQDGAQHHQDSGAERTEKLHDSVTTRSAEAEDARLTGGTRCLMRRLMGLNVTSAKSQLGTGKGNLPSPLGRQILTA